MPDRHRHQTGKGLWRAASVGGEWEEGEPRSEDSPKLGPDSPKLGPEARFHLEQARVPIFCISDTLASGALPTPGRLPLPGQVTSDSTGLAQRTTLRRKPARTEPSPRPAFPSSRSPAVTHLPWPAQGQPQRPSIQTSHSSAGPIAQKSQGRLLAPLPPGSAASRPSPGLPPWPVCPPPRICE